jgi:hypothetical protein
MAPARRQHGALMTPNDLNSFTPRLYLLMRMIMDVSQDKTGR